MASVFTRLAPIATSLDSEAQFLSARCKDVRGHNVKDVVGLDKKAPRMGGPSVLVVPAGRWYGPPAVA